MPRKRQIAKHDTSVAPFAHDQKSRQRMLNARQVAAYLSVSKQQIYALSRRGRIPHYRIGSLLRYRQNEIDAWLIRNHFDSSNNRHIHPIKKEKA